MKRLRSSDDLNSYEKNASKESNQNLNRSLSSHRSSSGSGFYYKSSFASDNNARSKSNLISPSSRYDRDRSSVDEDSNRERDRDGLRLVRKRSDHDFESSDGRKLLGFDRYRESGGSSSFIYRSESFCGSRRDFPKGFRSERDRSRRDGGTWRRFGVDDNRVGSKVQLREVRDTKSPTWSRDSLGVGRVAAEGREREDFRRRRSSKSMSKSRSPTWSRDSESGQSKSVGGGGEVKKSEDMADEGRSSSEMEEGELEPDPLVEPELETKVATNEGKECNNREIETEGAPEKANEEDDVKESVSEGNNEEEKEVDELQDGDRSLHSGASGNRDGVGVVDENGCGNEGECEKEDGEFEESSENRVLEKSLQLEENRKDDKGIDLEMKMGSEVAECEKEVGEENGGAKENMDVAEEGLSHNFKDKGKGIAVPLMAVADSAENGPWIERETNYGDDDMEGPSTRGFELFSCSPVRKVEKAEQSGVDKLKDEKLGLEPLDLSLSLPNVLLPIGAQDTNTVPGSPSHGRSFQSFNTFRTNSDGFTASMSYSGSQSFYHNPSCSLTQNSMDNYEQSVHSRPIFQGAEQGSQGAWPVQNESRHEDLPINQRILINGNGPLHQSQALQGLANGKVVHGQHIRSIEGSSKMENGLERQLSIHKRGDGGSPSQSAASLDVGSNYSFEKKRAAIGEKHVGSLYRSSSQKEEEQLLRGGADFVGTIISRIICDPIHVMARKLHEMTGQSVACLKESIRAIMLNADKHGQLSAIQSALKNRSDLTQEVLLKSHRAQLEILVALKTGLPEYLQLDNKIPSSDLAEIFLNLKCRNHTCRSPLPVDECDCKVCSKKKGFCSACMCLVCSKFDMASNTCSWVGCDVCLHWCHADCGLKGSYIRNGPSASGAQGATEMQFHCIACDHPSEMFGFVKEVCQHFAKDWTPKTFSKELEYVKRIFSGSKDVRGKRLHEIANQMLARLANKTDVAEVYSLIMAFLTESDTSKLGNSSALPEKEQGKGNNGSAGPTHDMWRKSVHSDKAPPQLESSSSLPPGFHVDWTEKRPFESDLLRNAEKQSFMPDLESFIKIKLEEAKMYQARADEARRAAEHLKQYATAKNEEIEGEYRSRITKLRLIEAEEMHKQKFEECQALERAHHEYFSMKMRMEADIKDLLLKMEATRRNLAM
ncbi:hypothetical protein SLE2022_176710 [Rubroshorea leprosula]